MSRHAALLADLRAGTLRPDGFTHRDHLGVAWEALSAHEFFTAVGLVAAGLRGLTLRAGVPEKYNATVTFACMSGVAERMAADPHPDAESFLAANGEHLTLRALMAAYRDERWTGPLARRVALLPKADAP